MTTLVELCAGSACVSLAALDMRRRLVPYMGGKWPYRHAILDALGVRWRPSPILLVDAGPWGDTWAALAYDLEGVRQLVAQYAAEEDHGETWERLRASVPDCPTERAAAHLTLQRLAYRGKPLEERGDRWADPGLSKTDAYGAPATARFDSVARQLPNLSRQLDALRLPGVTGRRCSAMDVEPIPGAAVYIDPPYRGTTGYGRHDLDRLEVVELATRWADAGCTVVVSEAEPIAEMTGWRHVRLSDPQSQMGRRREEWITCWGDPVQLSLEMT